MNTHPPTRRRRARTSLRQGFTLIEILLALGLSVLLMAAVYSAIDLYWRVSSAGREQMERSQLARAIFRELASDIRSVVYREAEAAATETEEGTTTGGYGYGTEETTSELVDPSSAYTSTSVGVYGDSQMLVLHVSRPSRELDYSGPGESLGIGSRRSDLQSVSYFLSDAGAGGLQGAVGNVVAGGSTRFATTTGIQGLARLEGDRLTMDTADVSADLDTLAANTRLLAAEVQYIYFRYFDGYEWYETWDSEATGLPQAIEVTLGLAPPREEVTSGFVRVGAAADEEEFRTVIALPLAKPFAAEVAAGTGL